MECVLTWGHRHERMIPIALEVSDEFEETIGLTNKEEGLETGMDQFNTAFGAISK